MKKIKRILSVILISVLVFPVLVYNVNASNNQKDGYWFTDDFSYTTSNLAEVGWTNTGNLLVDELTSKLNIGKVGGSTSSYTYLGGNSGVLTNWENYTVEADVAITDTELTSNGKGRTAGLVIGVPADTQSGAKGYEFMICNTVNGGKQYCALKDRTGAGKHSEDVTCDVKIGETYTLKMEVKETQILCYMDDKLMFVYDYQGTSEHPFRGTIGLHGSKNVAEADSVRVWSNSVPWFTDCFTTNDLTVNEWKSSKNLALIDANTDKLNVGYEDCGESIVYSYLGGYPITDAMENFVVQAEVKITDSAFKKTSNKPLAALVVGADTSNTGKEDGYQFLIRTKGDVQLTDKDKTADNDYTISGGTQDCTIEVGKTYNLKIVVQGNKIKCYLDNNLKIEDEYKGTAEHPFAGLIGFRAQINVLEVDNVLIRPIAETADNYYNISFYRNGRTTAIHPYKENAVFQGWYEDAEFTKPLGDSVTTGNAYAKFVEDTNKPISFTEEFNGTCHSGWNNLSGFTVTDNNLVSKVKTKYTYLEGYKGAENWSNYTVEADVVITDETIEGYTGSGRIAGIVAAAEANTKTNGYEFMIVHDAKDASMPYYYQLKDRNAGKDLTSSFASDFELGKTYTLKMVLDGNTIYCYINDELKISYTVEGVDVLSGTIGLHAQGNVVEFDNVRVYNTQLVENETEEADDSLWFTEYFNGTSQDLLNNGWNTTSGVVLTPDEQLQLSQKRQTPLYLKGFAGAADWSNYAVETDVILTDKEITGNTSKSRIASLIVAANDKNKGYELLFYYNTGTGKTYYQLKDRITETDLTKAIAYPYTLNTLVNLKLTAYDNTIEIHIDGELEHTVTVPNVSVLKGTIGLKGLGNVTYFDNVKVYEAKPSYKLPALTDVRGKQVWFKDNFSSKDSIMTERGWAKDYEIHGGKLYMPGNGASTAYLNGIEKVYEWQDYTAQVDVCIADIENFATSVQQPAAFLCMRSISEKTGYDYGVMWNAGSDTGWIRLQNRTTDVTLVDYKEVPIQKGQTYQLKMMVKGNQISCYLDGDLIITYVDKENTNPVGTAGVRKSGYETYFDNFAVYENGMIYSPATGDMTVICCYICVLAISACVITAFVWRRRREKQL